MWSLLRQTVVVFLALTVVTGLVYPLAITVVAQAVFPHQANGSLIEQGGKVVGSELIGQQFDDRKYFWGRPSSTTPPYNAASSTGSNYGPTNPDQLKAVHDHADALRKAHPDQPEIVPIDLVTASGSGLDPHISPAAAEYQISRIAKSRGVNAQVIRDLLSQHTSGRQLGFLGESRVNVLKLNLALDNLK
jgi:K+-transporting ATPase ATPase C chain